MRKNPIPLLKRELRKHLLLMASITLLFSWFLVFEFTNTFYYLNDDIIYSVTTDTCIAITGFFGVLFGYKVTTSQKRFLPTNAFFFLGIAILLLITFSLFQGSEGGQNAIDTIPESLFIGILTGIGVALLILSLLPRFWVIETVAIEAILFMFIFSVLILLICMLVPKNDLPIMLSIILILSGCLYGNHLYRINNQAASSIVLPSITTTAHERKALQTLGFLSGFLLAYMVIFHPRSAHTAEVYVPTAIGGMSVTALLMLLVTCVLMLVIYAFLHTKLKMSLALIIAFALFAAIYSVFPFMRISPLPFILATPCAICNLLISTQVLFAIKMNAGGEEKSSRAFLKPLLSVLLAPMAGAICAGLITIFFFVFIFQTSFQREYVIIPIAAVTLLAVLLLIIYLRKCYLAVLLGKEISFVRQLDSSRLDDRCRMIQDTYSLTARELEVMILLANGRNAPYIANKLFISLATVKTHISHIYKKVGVGSCQELLDILQA